MFRVKPSECPCCHNLLDAASSLYLEEAPEKGDITICFKCTNILEFNDQMDLEKISIEAWQECGEAVQNNLKRLQKAIQKEKR